MFLLLPSLHFTTDNRKSFPQKYLPLGYTLKQKLVRPQASPGSKIALQPSVHLLILLLIQKKSNYLSLSLLIRFVLQKSMLCMVICTVLQKSWCWYLSLAFQNLQLEKKYCCSVKVVITQPIFHSNTNKTCQFCPFPPKQCHKNWTCFK